MSEKSTMLRRRKKLLRYIGSEDGRVRGWCSACRRGYNLVLDGAGHIACSDCGAHDLLPRHRPFTMSEREWERWVVA